MGQSFVGGTEWARLLSDTGCGALVVDVHARIVLANDPAARVYAKRPAGEVTGLRFTDFLRPHAADERAELSRKVIETGRPVVFTELWSGVAMRATIRRADEFPGAEGPVAVWVLCPEGSTLDPLGGGDASMTMIEARNVDLGTLSRLTPSELRVMALIGEGMSNAETAATLHRAVKTVESHRASLTDKTGITSRVELGVLARRAGLIRRIELPKGEPKPGPAPRGRGSMTSSPFN